MSFSGGAEGRWRVRSRIWSLLLLLLGMMILVVVTVSYILLGRSHRINKSVPNPNCHHMNSRDGGERVGFAQVMDRWWYGSSAIDSIDVVGRLYYPLAPILYYPQIPNLNVFRNWITVQWTRSANGLFVFGRSSSLCCWAVEGVIIMWWQRIDINSEVTKWPDISIILSSVHQHQTPTNQQWNNTLKKWGRMGGHCGCGW